MVIMTPKKEDNNKNEKLKHLIIFICWIALYFIYIIVGGAVISSIEGDQDLETKRKRKQKFISTLNKYNFSVNDTAIKEIVSAALDAVEVINTPVNDLSSSWNLNSGMFFCNALVTTIGKCKIISYCS